MYPRSEERDLPSLKRITGITVKGEVPLGWDREAPECSQMEKTRVYRSWDLWNDLEDPKLAKATHSKDWGGVWERRAYPRKREALHWTKEHSCQAIRSWSCLKALDLSTKP